MVKKITMMNSLCKALNKGFANYGDDFDFGLVSKIIKKLKLTDVSGFGDRRFCTEYIITNNGDEVMYVMYEDIESFRIERFSKDDYMQKIESGYFNY